MRVINDFLDKRGNIYSHRPDFTVVGELMGLDQVGYQPFKYDSLLT